MMNQMPPMKMPPMGAGMKSAPSKDTSYIDDIMGEDISGEEGLPEDKAGGLESALSGLGYKVTPDKLAQIESILSAPDKGAKPGMPTEGKPPAGGIIPGGMGSDLTMG